MIRQAAFTGNEKMLKGALHCHTTRSDGALSPDDALRRYKESGYDFVALTDHRKYNFENFAPETGLTLIPGMEYDSGNLLEHGSGFRCFHTVCIGPSKEDGNGFEHDEYWESAVCKNQEEFQTWLDEIHKRNNLTVYCHPEWSGTPTRWFEKQKGHFAMEVWNSVCALGHDMDKDAAYWDELLGQGIRIFGVAADDAHGAQYYCHGWVMVRAENTVNAILEALKNGAFYSSCGPKIYDFYVEDDKAYVQCSPVSAIRLDCDKHPAKLQRATDGSLTCASFELKDWSGGYDYARITVIDKDGKHAWTNPIFLR